MKHIFILLLTFAMSVPAIAGGGKMREANEVLTPETCVINIPEGLEDEDCQELTAPDQSGVAMFVCNVVFICDE